MNVTYKNQHSRLDLKTFKESFEEKGFFIVRNLLDSSEIQLIRAVHLDMKEKIKGKTRSFREGRVGFDIEALKGSQVGLRKVGEIFLLDRRFRQVCANSKILEIARALLGEQIYYHSSKLMCKPARGGRRKTWHQDFGYWSTMDPRQVTIWTAIDSATRENGCVKVLPASHRHGLIEHHHGEVELQVEEKPEYDRKAVYAEMNPGDVLFFSVLLLHSSEPNHSQHPRLSTILNLDSRPKPPDATMGSEVELEKFCSALDSA